MGLFHAHFGKHTRSFVAKICSRKIGICSTKSLKYKTKQNPTNIFLLIYPNFPIFISEMLQKFCLKNTLSLAWVALEVEASFVVVVAAAAVHAVVAVVVGQWPV